MTNVRIFIFAKQNFQGFCCFCVQSCTPKTMKPKSFYKMTIKMRTWNRLPKPSSQCQCRRLAVAISGDRQPQRPTQRWCRRHRTQWAAQQSERASWKTPYKSALFLAKSLRRFNYEKLRKQAQSIFVLARILLLLFVRRGIRIEHIESKSNWNRTMLFSTLRMESCVQE